MDADTRRQYEPPSDPSGNDAPDGHCVHEKHDDRPTAGSPSDVEVRQHLRGDAEAYGARELARRIGCSREALLGLLSGLRCRAGTMALGREYVRRSR